MKALTEYRMTLIEAYALVNAKQGLPASAIILDVWRPRKLLIVIVGYAYLRLPLQPAATPRMSNGIAVTTSSKGLTIWSARPSRYRATTPAMGTIRRSWALSLARPRQPSTSQRVTEGASRKSVLRKLKRQESYHSPCMAALCAVFLGLEASTVHNESDLASWLPQCGTRLSIFLHSGNYT